MTLKGKKQVITIEDDDGKPSSKIEEAPAGVSESLSVTQTVSTGSNGFWNTKVEVRHILPADADLEDVAEQQRLFVVNTRRLLEEALMQSE